MDVSFKAGAATAVEQADATAQLRAASFGATADELTARLAALKLLKVGRGLRPGPRHRALRAPAPAAAGARGGN